MESKKDLEEDKKEKGDDFFNTLNRRMEEDKKEKATMSEKEDKQY